MPLTREDDLWMDQALRLARRGLGRTWPRPSVGCVLVRAGRVIGRGHTSFRGEPPAHGEARALAHAGDARFATAYVTLEPCAHHGQTPPCADALVAAGVERVVSALEDPDPRVAGRGHDRLRRAGVAVDIGCRAAEAEAVNAGFLARVRRGRPHLTLKLAATLDARIATASGESRWITGPEARATVHLMRARHDAVLIGAGTARADDPMLDVRGVGLGHVRPVRVVADGGLSLPLTGRLAQSAADHPLWLMHRPGLDRARLRAWMETGARLLEVPVDGAGALDLPQALARLGAEGLTRVFCEGGGRLAAGLIAAGLVDDLVMIQAGKLIGAEGIPAVAALPHGPLAGVPGFRRTDLRSLGPDTLSCWRPQDP